MSRSKIKPSLIMHINPSSPVADAYRDLRINLEFAAPGQTIKTVAVVSAYQGEGKTTTIINLAAAYTQAGKKTLLVDADLRKPSVHDGLHLDNLTGLSDVLAGRLNAGAVIRDSGIPDLSVITSGSIPINPSELLASPAFESFLAEMKEQYDAVLIDTPPVLSVMDGKIVAAKCDGVLIVMQHGKVKREDALRVKEELAGVGARMLGVSMNNIHAKEIEKYPY